MLHATVALLKQSKCLASTFAAMSFAVGNLLKSPQIPGMGLTHKHLVTHIRTSVVQTTTFYKQNLPALDSLCQPDIIESHLRGGNFSSERASIRVVGWQACGAFP